MYFMFSGILGYLCGAIPFGYLYVRLFKGQDLRQIGSGRTGGTNSLRAGGLAVGILTGASDAFKGALAIWLVRFFFGDALGPEWLPWLEISAGICAVMGHNWSIFLGFTGGAGTGPNVGWALAIWPWLGLIGFIVVVGLLLAVGMASVASLSTALVIPLTFAVLYALGIVNTPAYVVGGLITAVIVTWSLRPNIERLLAGNERVVGPAARRQNKS
ncbi:MAG TPA: glycerol-3-phosphate acyltransferase [Anaerolineae bacterium]|nr:glycerol-3-phosphate acyltransferase [Anaerolineae bacterium]